MPTFRGGHSKETLMLTEFEKLVACGATYFGIRGLGKFMPDGTVAL